MLHGGACLQLHDCHQLVLLLLLLLLLVHLVPGTPA
jgi:hypothetical protein